MLLRHPGLVQAGYALSMRPFAYAALAVCVSFATPALADDDEGDWFEEDAEEVEEQPAPPPKKQRKKKKKRVEVVVEDDGAAEPAKATPPAKEVPPDWARGRRGKFKKTLPAVEGEKPPPGYRLEERSRKNLWIPGVVLLSTGYAASALTSATALVVESADCSWDYGYSYYGCESRDWAWGFLPLAGPFVIAADRDFEPGWRAAYALFGISQVVGLGLTIGGAASKKSVWVLKPEHRNRAGSEERPVYTAAPAPAPELTVGAGFASVKASF